MELNEIGLVKRQLSELPYSFVIDDVSLGYLVDQESVLEVNESIENDPNFIITREDGKDGFRYVSKKTLYCWSISLLVKLALSNKYSLNEQQLLSQMNHLRVVGRWEKIPANYISYLQELGLIGHFSDVGKYVFPISYFMSFLNNPCIRVAQKFLASRNSQDDITTNYEDLVIEFLRIVLLKLTEKQQDVLKKRQGIFGFTSMTLEEISKTLHPQVTRERVRQIETKCWKRIWHDLYQKEFVHIVLVFVLNRKGSLVFDRSKIKGEIEFICKCLNVPIWESSEKTISGFGVANVEPNYPEQIWMDLVNLKSNIKIYLTKQIIPFSEEDLERISALSVSTIINRLTKVKKVYLALKNIGTPSHFTQVKDMYTQMFPNEKTSDHSIQALLLREQYGVVWTGSKGTFALEEWGFSRPLMSIHDAIATIVYQKYRETNNPVSITYIQAEISKYRKLINPNSIIIGAYCNPKVAIVNRYYFVPKDNEIETDINDDEIDQILLEFENKTRENI
jgi:hypothetical protein